MSLTEKISLAHFDIDHALVQADKEAFAVSSFGKDSLVLLHLLSRHGVRNVLHLEDVDEVVDRPFIQQCAKTYGLTIYPLSRGRVLFAVVKDTPVFTALTFVNDRHLMCFPTTMQPYSGSGAFVCVDAELQAMRTQTLDVEFDLLFSGIKHADLTGKGCLSFMNLLSEATMLKRLDDQFAPTGYRPMAPGLMACDPLLHWTDEDVWAYIKLHDLPWSRAVYNDDHTKRPTGMQWCFRCHDPRENSIVRCPRIGRNILNLAAMAQDADLQVQRMGRLGLLNEAEVKELTDAK